MLRSQNSEKQFSFSSLLLFCYQFFLYLLCSLVREPEKTCLFLVMTFVDTTSRFFSRYPYKPYSCASVPKAIQRAILQQNPLHRFLTTAQRFRANASRNIHVPATGIPMGIKDILLQAPSTKVDPIFTPDDINKIVEEGFPVSKHLLRKLKAEGRIYREIPLLYGRQISLPDVPKASYEPVTKPYVKQLRQYPSRPHKTKRRVVHPYRKEGSSSESRRADFYQHLQTRKDHVIAKTGDVLAQCDPEVLVDTKSVPSHPLFDLPSALPADCEEKIKGGMCNRVPLATNLTPSDLSTLQNSQWLNGDAINASLSLLTERSNRPVPGHKDLKYPNVFAFPTYFFDMLRNQGYAKVARQAKKKQIFSKDLVLVPIHLSNHWTLLSIDFRHKLVTYFDSLLGSPQCPFDVIKAFLEEASKDILKQPFDIASWRFECPNQIPTQKNGYDCGMFCIMFSKSLASPFYRSDVSNEFPFNQSQMQMLRLLVSYEVVTGQLLHS